MAFIICVAALIIMMFVFTQMLLSFSNNSISIYFDENMLSHSAAGKNVCIESVDENDKI